MIEVALRSAVGPLRIETLRGLLPANVGVGLRRADDAPIVDVFPEELALLGPRATEGRRRSFALGRAAAHAALADLGIAPAPVGRGGRGEPLWPRGAVGAIAHTGSIGVAVVGRSADFAGLGVDIELHDREVQDAAARLVCGPAERAWTDQAWTAAERSLRRLAVFCGKEAVFKALYPIEGVYLGFSDAELSWREQPAGFVATLCKPAGSGVPAGRRFDVRCALVDDVLAAALAVPRTETDAPRDQPRSRPIRSWR